MGGTEWISVEDRLPEAGEHVWCFCFEDYQQICAYEKTKDWGGGEVSHWFKTPYGKYKSVTHWMLLPEPPND